jgi:hypothetical protein
MEELSEMTTIKLRRASAAGNAPSSLVAGEIAISEFDGLEYRRDPSGAVYAVNVSPLQPEGNLIFDSLYRRALGNKQADGGDSNPIRTWTAGTYISPTEGCWVNSTTSSAVGTTQRVTDAPTGFDYSFKMSVTTADATVGAADHVNMVHWVRLHYSFRSQLRWGTANARSLRWGFWVKAKRPGTYGVSFHHYAPTIRAYVPTPIVINSADTWEYKTVTIAGDTTAGIGVYTEIHFCVMGGSDYQATANTWNTSWRVTTSAQTNGAAATSDYFQIAGMSIHIGDYMPTAALSRYLHRAPLEDQMYLREVTKRYGFIFGGNTTVYVDPTNGNDMNDGRHPNSAFATLQQAIELFPFLDCNGHELNIQIASGTQTCAPWFPRGSEFGCLMFINVKPPNCPGINIIGSTTNAADTTIRITSCPSAGNCYVVLDESQQADIPIRFDYLSIETTLSQASYWTVIACAWEAGNFQFKNVRVDNFYNACYAGSYSYILLASSATMTIYGTAFSELFSGARCKIDMNGTLERGINITTGSHHVVRAVDSAYAGFSTAFNVTGAYSWSAVISIGVVNLSVGYTNGKTPGGAANISTRSVLDNVWTA